MPYDLDLLDGSILKQVISPGSFRWNVRESYSKMAKRLGISEETLRKRLARLRKAGIIGNFILLLNPHLIGRECAAIYLEGATKHAIPELRLLEVVVSITALHKAGIVLIVFYSGEEGLKQQVSLIESICKTQVSMLWKIPFPPFTQKVTKTDWMIFEALRKDPRRKASDLAASAGISTRTLNRRATRLNDSYAFFLELEINAEKAPGLPYAFLVRCDDPTRKREIDYEILSKLKRLGYSDTVSPSNSVFSVASENISEIEELTNWIKNIDGVTQLKGGIIESRNFVDNWIDREIKRSILSFA